MLRSSEFYQSYNYMKYDLDTPIIIPNVPVAQNKTGYRFTADTRNVNPQLDWCKASFDFKFKFLSLLIDQMTQLKIMCLLLIVASHSLEH